MPSGFARSHPLLVTMTLGLLFTAVPFSLSAQRPPGQSGGPPSPAAMNNPGFDLDIAVRDAHGGSLEAAAVVRLSSPTMSYNETAATQSSSMAHFSGLAPGEYLVEVTCPGFRKSTEHFILEFGHASLPVYVYLVPESDPHDPAAPTQANILPQQLRADMRKGMEALNKRRYEAAQKIFAKVLSKAPDNPDALYYLGLAELGMRHTDVARDHFQRTLSLSPNHELALVSLGYLQLQSGAPADAVTLFQKAVSLGRGNWRVNYDLAYAYLKVNRLSDAESEALRAVGLAKGQGAAATFLLGQIQYTEGKQEEAKRTLESILKTFPSDPVATETTKTLMRMEAAVAAKTASADASVPLPTALDTSLVTIVERPWAPPDIDSAVYDLAPDVTCKTDTVLDAALLRMKSQLLNFEKFAATEHIEHQDIDRHGLPGSATSRDYSYIVFVYPLGDSSFYVRESRDGSDEVPGFPDAITTTSIYAMGVNVLQPFYRDRFNYLCEGLAHLRGQAAWQVHFAQKPEAKSGVRTWQLKEKTYEVPVKGRIWISSLNFAVLRVETDLREPVKDLQLTKDHLLVDYGPVNFAAGSRQLWLPWNADMYVEFRGKRYHHRHYLSDYLFFAVDATTKFGKPKESEE
jgi:Flp pilus assembly protein TadD